MRYWLYITLLALGCIGLNSLSAQTWQKHYYWQDIYSYGSSPSSDTKVEPTHAIVANNAFYVTLSRPHQSILKFDTTGTLLDWHYYDAELNSIQAAPNGDILIAGTYSIYPHAGDLRYNAFFEVLDKDLRTKAIIELPDSNNEVYGMDFGCYSTDQYYVILETHKPWLLILDENFDTLQFHDDKFHWPISGLEHWRGLLEPLSNGDFLFTDGYRDLGRVDTSGEIRWYNNYLFTWEPWWAYYYDYMEDDEGNLLVTGLIEYDSPKLDSIFIRKFNAEGELLWEWKEFVGIAVDKEEFKHGSLMQLDDGAYLLCQSRMEDSSFDISLSRFSKEGVEEWVTYFGGLRDDRPINAGILSSGYGLVGMDRSVSTRPIGFPRDTLTLFLAKTDWDGEVGSKWQIEPLYTEIAFEEIGINNINAGFSADGMFYHNHDTVLFNVPRGGNTNAMQSGGIWVAAKDETGQVFTSSYRYGDMEDFLMGPLDSMAYTSFFNARKWNKLWKASREKIECFKHDWADNGTLELPIPDELLDWPAIGNPYVVDAFGQPLAITEDMAPFVDVHEDGVYNPYDGDYPDIQGDEMLWWVFSAGQERQNHQKGLGMGIQIHASAWAYNCLQDSILNNSIFVSVAILNKSERHYSDLRVSHFIDVDLGCFTDDYMGSDTSSNAGFVYNGDTYDENCQTLGYGPAPIPMFSSHGLSHTMAAFARSYDEVLWGWPNSPKGYHNMMQGLWANDLPYEYGGDGLLEGTFSFPYLFMGNPADTTQWSMCSNGWTPFDMDMVSSFGPFDFPPDSSVRLDFVNVFHPGDYAPCPDISFLTPQYEYLKAHYADESFPTCIAADFVCDSTGFIPPQVVPIRFSPNPFQGNGLLEVLNLNDYNIFIYDVLGHRVYEQFNASGGTHYIDLSLFSSGPYIIQVKSRHGQGKLKIIKTDTD